MRRPLILSPMPVDLVGDGAPGALVIRSVAHAEDLFGVGSQMARAARVAIEGPPVRHCACGRTVNGTYAGQCGDCYRRDQRLHALWRAFSRVVECIAVVEARASALFVSDVAEEKTLTEWRAEALRETAETFAKDPFSLPFMCGGLDDEPGDDL